MKEGGGGGGGGGMSIGWEGGRPRGGSRNFERGGGGGGVGGAHQ